MYPSCKAAMIETGALKEGKFTKCSFLAWYADEYDVALQALEPRVDLADDSLTHNTVPGERGQGLKENQPELQHLQVLSALNDRSTA
jgi:hypothetical protein